MLDKVVLFCHDVILFLYLTILNAVGNGVYYLGYLYVGIKYNYKETREIKFQTLRRMSRSLGHAAIQWRG
jgi:hypothetical protein